MSSSFPFTAATLIMLSFFYSISPLLATSANKNLLISTPTIAAAPAVLPESPLASPPSYQELSPDITPLLPSPSAGVVQPAIEPIIPSSPSPPNPDDVLVGPDSAYAPAASFPDSSASRCFISLGFVYKLFMVFGVLCFWLS